MAAKKSASKRTDSKQKGKSKVGKVMHEFKHHELRSGSGKKVTNPKQAIAIGLSEAREAGAKIPKKGAAKKRTAAKKKAPSKAKKSTSRSTSTRKRTARKS